MMEILIDLNIIMRLWLYFSRVTKEVVEFFRFVGSSEEEDASHNSWL